MKKQFVLCLFAMLASTFAKAGAGLFEPAAVYQFQGKYSSTGSAPFENFSGFGYGLRLGWQFLELPILIGAEYYSLPSTQFTNLATSTNTMSGSENWLGAFFGFRYSDFRVIGAYLFSDNQEAKTYDSNQSLLSDIKSRGTGYKVGLYYSLMHHVSLGIEYYAISYTSSSSGAGYNPMSPAATKSSLMASLSFPFHFLAEGGGGQARR